MKNMNDSYIYRMSLIAMQALQLHEDIKDLLQHYHDDALAGAVPETVGGGTAVADIDTVEHRPERDTVSEQGLGPRKCNSFPE